MKYKRVERLDACYMLADGNPRREKREVKYNWDTTLQRNFDESVNCGLCICCRTRRKYVEFPKLNKPGTSIKWKDRDVLTPISYTSNLCLYCMVSLVEEYKQTEGLTDFEAFYRVCALAGTYYDDDLAHAVFYDNDLMFDDGVKMDPETNWIDRYFRKKDADEILSKKDFWDRDSDDFQYRSVLAAQSKVDPTIGMSGEDKDNYNTIWATYHYDPFADDSPKDRSRLMADLATMIDDAMKDDLVRMRAALEIVRAFARIDKIGETLNQLQSTPEATANNSNAIKQLTAAKTQETQMVTSFSKDHGFAEKYATAKSKGSGTLSAVIRDMKEANYDFGTVNRYDIATSEAIKQVSDISAESIFKQLGLASADYADMVREQAAEIKKMKEELDKKEEELRLFKEKHLKQELLEELKDDLIRKNIPAENVEEMINKEYTKNKVFPPL